MPSQLCTATAIPELTLQQAYDLVLMHDIRLQRRIGLGQPAVVQQQLGGLIGCQVIDATLVAQLLTQLSGQPSNTSDTASLANSYKG